MDPIKYFKFCPNCRQPFKKPVIPIDCQNCGFHLYLKPALTTALILGNAKGEVLLTKRKSPPKKNYWDLPGGFVDFKETAEQCLRREIKEELGINLKRIKYFGSYWSYYPYRGIRYQTLCLVYTATYRNEKIKIHDDVVDYRFFLKKKIPIEKLSFDDVRHALVDYLKRQLSSFCQSQTAKNHKNRR